MHELVVPSHTHTHTHSLSLSDHARTGRVIGPAARRFCGLRPSDALGALCRAHSEQLQRCACLCSSIHPCIHTVRLSKCVCLYVCMYACMNKCMYECMYTYICMHVCMYTCTFTHIAGLTLAYTNPYWPCAPRPYDPVPRGLLTLCPGATVCTYIYTYTYIYIHIYIYVYIYMYM
jgi:hypothetical protein